MRSLRISGIMLMIVVVQSLLSCKDYLQKPLITDQVNQDVIFSSTVNAETFLWQTYRVIIPMGWPLYDKGKVYHFRRSMLCDLSDECDYAIGASPGTRTNIAGFNPSSPGDYLPDIYQVSWDGIRNAWIFIENVDRVPDMSKEEKDQMKAEAKTLIALRYLYMMKRYGGVPIVKKSLTVNDKLDIPRASINSMVNFIVGLCNTAAETLPDMYPPQWKGRVTKGVALAVKASTLLFAASPEFNSDMPVENFGGNDSLISYPSYDVNRWRVAADANKAVIDWALSNGHYIINTGHPFDDFGNAVSEPDNPEIIFAYKGYINQDGWWKYYLPHLGSFNEGHAITYNFLPMFYKADGTDQAWPEFGDAARPFSEYTQKMEEMGPRFKQTAWAYGQSAWANPNLPLFQWDFGEVDGQNVATTNVAKLVKFTYKYRGGNDKNYSPDWPVFRLAEFYLNYAEALNEYSPNDVKAYNALNVIRDRAGLPLITPGDPKYNTQDALRKLIWRERAVELFAEGHRFFDIRRWRIAGEPGVGGGPFYAFHYTENAAKNNYLTYKVVFLENRMWKNALYFLPFPQTEVNKGILIQNPGY